MDFSDNLIIALFDRLVMIFALFSIVKFLIIEVAYKQMLPQLMRRRGWFFRLMVLRLPTHALLSYILLVQFNASIHLMVNFVAIELLGIFIFNVVWYHFQKRQNITKRTGSEIVMKSGAYSIICLLSAHALTSA